MVEMLKDYTILIKLTDGISDEVQFSSFVFPKKVNNGRLTITWIEKDNDGNKYAETIIRDKEIGRRE